MTDLDALARRFLRDHPGAGRRIPPMVRLLERCTPRRYNPGQLMMREGAPGHELLLLVRGAVGVFRDEADGQRRKLGQVNRPRLLGHMSLVDGSPRSATCVAESEVDVLVMDEALVKQLMASPTRTGSVLRRLLLTSMAVQLADTTRRLDEAMEQLADLRTGSERALLDELTGRIGGWTDDELHEAKRVQVVR